MIDTKALREVIGQQFRVTVGDIELPAPSGLTAKTTEELLDEIDTLRAQLSEYAPIREYYGPAGLKAVSELIRERDEARADAAFLYAAATGLRSVTTPCAHGNPDQCKECRGNRT